MSLWHCASIAAAIGVAQIDAVVIAQVTDRERRTAKGGKAFLKCPLAVDGERLPRCVDAQHRPLVPRRIVFPQVRRNVLARSVGDAVRFLIVFARLHNRTERFDNLQGLKII